MNYLKFASYEQLQERTKKEPVKIREKKLANGYLEIYADETTTFKDIDKEWILGFKDFLNTVEKDSHKFTHKKDKSVFQGLSQNSKLSYFNKLRCCINKAFEDGMARK